MSMFCYQCQETARNTACTTKGVCGKNDTTSNLHDLLIHILQGIALHAESKEGALDRKYGTFMSKALFATITNANFDDERITLLIEEALSLRNGLREETGGDRAEMPGPASWEPETGGTDSEIDGRKALPHRVPQPASNGVRNGPSERGR